MTPRMLPFQNRALDRRTLLRGIGAAMALPWLSAMAPAVAPLRRASPLRALFVFLPNGVKMDEWRPAQTGRGVELPYLLAPLQPVRHALTVFSELAIDGGRAHGDGAGDHARAAASFLTCAHPRKTGGADLRAGISVDQMLAQAHGERTRLPSLELGTERGASAGICDSGYSCAYVSNISWRTESTPVAKETDPRAVFERLFGDPQLASDAAAQKARRRATDSVLDAVREDARALAATLGGRDRAKLDDYLTAVRELERRLELQAAADAEQPPVPAAVLERGASFADRLDALYELLAMAFATDQTRVATMMLGNGGSNRSYRFLGVPQGHHDLSHHGRDPQKLSGVRAIVRFHVERFALFLQRLHAAAEGDATLLHQSLAVFGCGIGDGNAHNHDNLPVLLCGNGGGAVAGDRHEALAPQTPMANLYLSLLQTMGVPAERFADSTGALPL